MMKPSPPTHAMHGMSNEMLAILVVVATIINGTVVAVGLCL
jgi:hypothetical protein